MWNLIKELGAYDFIERSKEGEFGENCGWRWRDDDTQEFQELPLMITTAWSRPHASLPVKLLAACAAQIPEHHYLDGTRGGETCPPPSLPPS